MQTDRHDNGNWRFSWTIRTRQKYIRNIRLCKRSNTGIKQTRTTTKYRTTHHSNRLCYNPYCISCWTHKVLAITLFIPGTHRIGGRIGHRLGTDVLQKTEISCPCWHSNLASARSQPNYYTNCAMLSPLRAPSNRNRKRGKLPNLTVKDASDFTRSKRRTHRPNGSNV